MQSKLFVGISILAAVLAAPAIARAGDPLFIDPATGQPIRYAPGATRVFTDLGSLGPISNELADARVAFAWKQWTDVPTATFEATVVGDFAAIGLPDVEGANAGAVVGTFNGGGIHVVYDSNGTVLSDFFGAPPSVLGIASPEFGVEGTPEITESWVVLNGASVDPADVDALAFTGVMTHEFGHAINLGHAQTNGASVFFGVAAGPDECGALPYTGTPTADHVEVMYPFIDARIDGGTGVAQSTVDITDDMVSISNIYPAPGWTENRGSISGTITFPDGTTQIPGVNVIARNVADPFRDAVSAMTGGVARTDSSAQGKFALNGLTPGASYVVYVDGIVAGGYSIPPALFLPGSEEFHNGSAESADATADRACDFVALTPAAGTPLVANIAFNALPGAPALKVLGRDAAPFDISADGSTIVGYFSYAIGAPTWRWTAATGLEEIGGVGSTASIAPDGSAIVSNTLMSDGFQVASLWMGGRAWHQLPGLEGSCDGALPPTKSVAFGVSRGGSKVVGLGFLGEQCEQARAFQWEASTGAATMLETPEDSLQSRANGISLDGNVVWGFRVGETGFREAAIWTNGAYQSLSTDAAPIGEAYNASTDGRYVVGGFGGFENKAWLWSAKKGVRLIDGLPGTSQSHAFAVSDKGNVIVGQSGGFFDIAGFIWTPAMGAMKIEDFLRSQGTFIDPSVLLYGPNVLAANGKRIAGNGFSASGSFAWYFDLSKIKVCHANGNRTRSRTIEVSFPEGMDSHLAHGDTLGSCERLKW